MNIISKNVKTPTRLSDTHTHEMSKQKFFNLLLFLQTRQEKL